MNGRGLTECRSAADAGWQSSDTALPIRASLLTACPAEVLPGVLCVRGVQREFEDLLAVLEVLPVRGNRWLRSFADAQATSSMTVAFVERRRGQVPLIYTTNPRHGAEDCINNLYFLWKIQCRYFSICFIDSSNIASSEYRLSIIVLYLALSSFSVGTGLS